MSTKPKIHTKKQSRPTSKHGAGKKTNTRKGTVTRWARKAATRNPTIAERLAAVAALFPEFEVNVSLSSRRGESLSSEG